MGGPLVFDMGRNACNWEWELTDNNFKPAEMLLCENCRNYEKLISWLKPGENVDRTGNNEGAYEFDLNHKFAIYFVANGKYVKLDDFQKNTPGAENCNLFKVK